jgi:hypothetical protein
MLAFAFVARTQIYAASNPCGTTSGGHAQNGMPRTSTEMWGIFAFTNPL